MLEKILHHEFTNKEEVEELKSKLSDSIKEELKTIPSRSETVAILERLPDKEVPELFVNIIKRITQESSLFDYFNYSEIFDILENPEKSAVQDVEPNGKFKGVCTFTGEINLVSDDTARPYSERLRHLVSRGSMGTTSLEHENGHRRVFSPVENTRTFLSRIASKIDELKNGYSYNSAKDLHEVYARLSSIELCCGSYDWHGGEDDKFANDLYDIDTWKAYGFTEDSNGFHEKLEYCINSILIARLFFEEQLIADAVCEHGAWDEQEKVFPGLEKLISQIPKNMREPLAEYSRLLIQNERIKAIKIARLMVIDKAEALKGIE
jgi:hypothetical protein